MTGLLTKLLPDRAESRASVGAVTARPNESAGWLEDLLGGGISTAGRRVNAQSAMTVGAVFAAIRLLSSSIGQLPLAIMRREEDGRRTELRNHRLSILLNDAPNEYLTAIEYRELITSWALLHGNAISLLELRNSGEIDSILPIDPDKIRYWLTPDRRSMVYEYLRPNGQSMFIPREQVLHIRAPLGSAWLGAGLLGIARDAIGLSMVAEEHASRFYSNAAAPAGVLVTPKTLKKDTWERIRLQWNARHQGPENAFKTAILEDGLEWKPISLNLRDQQFLETRTFQVQEIARWVGIPPHLIGELTRSTNNNIEAQGIEFVAFALGAWCIRWEQRIKLDCFGPGEQRQLYAKHNMNAFLRGQTLDRYRAHQIGRMGGWLSQNDVRRTEDMDPIGPEGDVYMAPLNMVPADSFGDDSQDTAGGDAPPTVAGGAPPDDTVVRAARTMVTAIAPVLHDASARAVRRAVGEWTRARGGHLTDGAVEQHRQWCQRTIEPIARAFALGVAGASGPDASALDLTPLVTRASAAVVDAWAIAFRTAAPLGGDEERITAEALDTLAQLVTSTLSAHLTHASET